MNILTQLVEFIKAAFSNAANKDKYIEGNKIGMAAAVISALTTEGKEPGKGPLIEHPYHKQALAEHITFLQKYVKSKGNCLEPLTIGFGDSLLDLSRDLTSVKSEFNFSIGGSVSHQMLQMAQDLAPYLKLCNVKHVVIGCLLGNALLAHQDVQFSVDQAMQALTGVRNLFPEARVIVYMLPPCYNMWVNKNRLVSQAALVQWAVADYNAVAVDFKNFGSFFGFWPKIRYSDDGVHFGSAGKFEFDQLIGRAKRVKARSVVS